MVNTQSGPYNFATLKKKANPVAWKEAMRRTHNDWRRLFVQEDGSVVILNNRWV